MLCAERCAEGNENWRAAENYARQISERYPQQSWSQWFLFCNRTNHGDLESARAFAEQRILATGEKSDAQAQVGVGYFFWPGLYLKNHGKPEDARRYLKTAARLPGIHEWWQALVAQALRGLGDEKKADRAVDARADAPGD